MKFDGNRYAKKTSEKLLPNTVFETSSLMLNENSGFDMKYQINKVHNLKLAAKTINKVIIEPKETFSFWQLVRWADQHEKYKDGLNLVNGKIVGSYGGGLCQLSNMLFWLFLHTPLTIVERHGHAVESFPCGRCYNKKYLEYICVDEMGTLISPHYLTSSFPKLLEKNNLRHIRFHDLRHSCASLLLANGVPMKQIQEWLGHSDFSTTANVYAHLDYNSKLLSADAMVNGLSGALEVIS